MPFRLAKAGRPALSLSNDQFGLLSWRVRLRPDPDFSPQVAGRRLSARSAS